MTTSEPLSGLTPHSFRKGHVAEDRDADLAGQVFVLDLQESLPAVQRLRDWTLDHLAVRAGDVAVDVGCGTGAEVRRLAALVGPTGRAVGIEPHAGLRAVAQERASGTGAEFRDGDAVALPFETGSVDALRCERVFQHLPDAEAAAAEFARVLAPGGRVVVVDSDWGSQVAHPGDPDVHRRVREAMWARAANPFAGRLLRGQLRRAGLDVDPDIAATAVAPPPEGVVALLRLNTDLAVLEGAVSQDEADRLLGDFEAAIASGEAFLAVTMFGVLARKPG